MKEKKTNRDYSDWMRKVKEEAKAHEEYRERAKRVEDRYIEEKPGNRVIGTRFNILYSNTEVIHSSILSETPKPDVRRRFTEQDLQEPDGRLKNKLAKDVSTVIERALSFSIDEYDFKAVLDSVTRDYLVPGLGIARVVYDPDIRTMTRKIPVEVSEDFDDEGNDIIKYEVKGEAVDPEKLKLGPDQIPYMEDEVQEKVFERVFIKHMPWSRFLWEPADSWENTNWAGFEYFLCEDDLKQFKNWEDIPRGYSREGNKIAEGSTEQGTHARIYEVFCKRSKTIKIFCEGMHDFIDIWEDEFNLSGFYPFPKPIFSLCKSGKLIPVPLYTFYQDQAEELDKITGRISGLVDELKHRGVYDGTFYELAVAIKNSSDGDLVPVDDWSTKFSQGRSLKDVVSYFPLDELIKTIQSLMQERESIKQTIYEINGISDIIRGASKASETLGAQKIKAQFAGLRNRLMQGQINRFVRDTMRIKAEIIASQFSAKTLTEMTGITVTPEMEALLRNDALRAFKVDVETDSTAFKDADEDKKNRVELLTSITSYLQSAIPAVMQGAVPMELAKGLLMFAVRGFKDGREIEDILDELGNEVPGGQGMAGPAPGQAIAGGGGAGNGNGVPGQLPNNLGGMLQ